MWRLPALLFSLSLFYYSCQKDPVPPSDDDVGNYELGKNRYTTEIDGDTREYYVHVPTDYMATTPSPVVFMLHGTSGDGEKMYNISGWKEQGEAENFLTVFPSSWRYCIIEDGETMNTTKFNIFPGAFDYCAGEDPKDDVQFFRKIIDELKATFNVDAQRIYLVGFSNGGQMAFRCALEMSDVFAAIVENAASTASDTTAVPAMKIPVSFQMGNEDDRYFSSPAPLSQFESALNNIPIFQRYVHAHISTFDYSEEYTISGDTNTVIIATYPSKIAGDNKTFNMVLVKDLGHAYPNTNNHWMNGAKVHWEWMKQFVK